MTKGPDLDFRLLFEHVPGLFLVLSPNAPTFTILGASEAYLQATHTQRNAIVGRGLFDVFPDNPDDPNATGVARLRQSLERVLATNAPDTMAVQKYDVKGVDGSFEERYWSPMNSPVLGRDRAVQYIVHRVEDVTAVVAADSTRSRLENEIIVRSQELDEARRRLEEMVAEIDLPLLRTWSRILTVPLLGTMNVQRLERMRARMLDVVNDERIRVVIFDLTGVSTVTARALKTLTDIAQQVRLCGSLPLLCGLRAEAAVTLAESQGNLDWITVFATQADALEHALPLAADASSRRAAFRSRS